jgi:6-phosphogluconolactonase/glucosamine-6-phosphate isomerase/deaminase
MGMADLMRARRVLLVVSGAHKREVLARMIEGGLTTSLPASFLRMHEDALCLCDRDAAGGLAGPGTSASNSMD